MIEKRIPNPRIILNVLYLVLRYYAGFTLLMYGFAKIMGAQFTVLDSQLAKPMGDVSGFWLTWYYFGYSPVYSTIIAFTQIAGALLLCFRRTALFGALVLLPVMVNIVCVDIWVIHWRFGFSALRNALYVLLALLIILAFHMGHIYRFLFRRRDDLAVMTKRRSWTLVLQIAVIVGMFAYTAHDGYWLANVNNRAPTPIDGAWQIVQVHPDEPGLPAWIYFEYNRAHMTVFRYPGGAFSEFHDFRVDAKDHGLIISQQWLTPGSNIFKGTWERTGDTMRLTGSWGGRTPIAMILQRKHMPVKDHGFSGRKQ